MNQNIIRKIKTMLKHDKKINISVGGSRKSTNWQTSEMMWSAFTEKLKTPVKSAESLEDYMAMPKSRQDELKDVGGFVGGMLIGGRRKAGSVAGRDLITLDMDNIKTGGTNDLIKRVGSLGCAFVIYSTRKHSDYAPRLRVIIPLDRTVTAEEYEPIARKLADMIGMQFADPTTFEASRLMYWPSISANSKYVHEVLDAEFCSADGILGMYADWKDISSWPQVPGVASIEKRRIAKQEDPRNKRGIVGAFCRTYSITEAMSKFISGMYEETAEPGRYTYTGGTTTGGVIVYDGDLFMYSHHATDPCGGLLVNAFDMVRIHMYGEADLNAKEGTPATRMPSYVAMKRMAIADKAVVDLMNTEKLQRAKDAFDTETDTETAIGTGDYNFIEKLQIDPNTGAIMKTINNAVLVLENDPILKDKIAIDDFANRGVTLGALPWDMTSGKRWWTDADDANYYNYMETFYGLTGRDKLDNALLIVSNKNHINDVKLYLEGLTWDGEPRLDTMLRDYLGAEDSAYTRAVTRKVLVAAVARAITGDVKFDNMLIMIGSQGIGKSTMLRLLGREWFSDSLTTFTGKEASEMIQGTWINEIGELTAFNKQESNAVKQFMAKQDDIYREAYGRRTQKYKRRCVFIGTSNEFEILKDATGDRRFWPVDLEEYKPIKSVWDDLPGEVDQIWAEAYARWQIGEPLHLPSELEEMAKAQQKSHKVGSELEGQIEVFLRKRIPSNWYELTLAQKRAFLVTGASGDMELIEREKICAIEIWTEMLRGDKKHYKRANAVEINNAIAGVEGWKRAKTRMYFGENGRQRGFIKMTKNNGTK